MTLAEKQTFKHALALISNKYYAFIKVNPQVRTLMTTPEVLVKYLDQGPFTTNLSLSGQKQKPGCTVNGFTDSLTDPPTIYINRSSASTGTIIHELFHYLTAKRFEQSFSDAIIEGTTEYFTRKVLGQPMVQTATFAEFQVSRLKHYDEEHGNVNMARGFIKSAKPKDARRDYMKRAYFLGAKDAIEIFQEVVGGRD